MVQRIGVILEGEVENRFLELKKHYGIASSSDLIRLIISKQREALDGEVKRE